MFDFEDKLKPAAVAEQQYEAATYAEVLSADTEAIGCGRAMLIPFSTDMVSDADKEMLHNSFAEAFGMDTEGIIDAIKDGAKKFWAWLKKIWAKFKKAMSDLYKKIKGFLGFKEKEIDEAIAEYDVDADIAFQERLAKMDFGPPKELLIQLGIYKEEEDIAKKESGIEDFKSELKKLQGTNKPDFNIDPELYVTFNKGVAVLPAKETLSDMVADIKGLNTFKDIKGVVSCKTIEDPTHLYPLVSHISVLTANGIKTYQVPKGTSITTNVYGETKVDYKEHLESKKALIQEVKEKAQVAEDLVASTDKLIKELDGSDKPEDKAAVKEAQTMATVAKQQTTAATKQVNNVIIVKNKRTKNPKYKNKKKKKS